MSHSRLPAARGEGPLTLLLWALGLGVCLVPAVLLADMVRQGLGEIDLEFLTAAPRDAGRAGGILPVLVSTAGVLGVCLAVLLPLGLGTSLLLAEVSRSTRFGSVVRASLDLLAGVPSIVFGLFGNAFFCRTLGMGYSLAAGGLTLACMALPLMIRTTEAGLRAVSHEQRRAAAALGLRRSRTWFSVLLPSALPAVAVGVILGIGRALAETAAVLFTSGYGQRMPRSLLDSGRTLSVHIYDLAMNVPGGEPRAWATALVLVALLLAVNTGALGLARLWSRRLGGGP